MMNFVLKRRNCALKTRNVVLKTMNYAGHGHTAGNADAFPAFCCPANLLRPQPDRILQTVLKLDGVKMTSFNDVI